MTLENSTYATICVHAAAATHIAFVTVFCQ